MDHHYQYTDVVTYKKALREKIIKPIDELTNEEVSLVIL